jgi:hypothetical protein
MEEIMARELAFVVGYAVFQVLSTTPLIAAADFGTPEEAKAMLERAGHVRYCGKAVIFGALTNVR